MHVKLKRGIKEVLGRKGLAIKIVLRPASI